MNSNESKRLVKNTALIAVGNLSTKIVSFLLLPLYTGILTTEEYGTYDYILSIMAFVIPVVTLQTSESMFRFLIDAKDKKEKNEIMSEVVFFTLISMFVFCTIASIILCILHSNYLIDILLYAISHILVSLISAILRGNGTMGQYALMSFGVTATTLVTNIITIAVFHWGVHALFVSFIASHFIWFFVFFFKIKLWKYMDYQAITKEGMKSIIKYSIPMVPNKLSWSIVDLSDRIMVSNMISVAANGIYSVANKFPTLINTFYQFFYQAWTESSARILQQGKEKAELFYNEIYEKIKRILFAIVIILIVSMPLAFKIMINKNFSEGYLYVPFLAFGMYFSNISGFYGGIFTAYKDTKMLGQSTIVAAVINISINFIAISFLGLYAAAASTLIANVVIAVYRCKQTSKYITLKRNNVFFLQSVLVSIIISVLYYSNNIYLYILNVLIAVVYSLYINKDTMKDIIKMFSRKFRKK